MIDLPIPAWSVRWLIVAAAVLAASAIARAERAVEQLHAVGGEQILWLVTGFREPDEKTPLQWFSYLDKASEPPRALRIQPQLGRIAHVAMSGDSIHVFFADGVHFRYSKLGDCRELRLPDSVVPAAIGGDPAARSLSLWAMVTAQTADRVESDGLERQRRQASKPAPRSPAGSPRTPPSPVVEAPGPTTRPLGSYHLVQYDGSQWRPGFNAPSDFAAGGGVWLCARQDRQILIWQPEAKSSEILSAWRIDGQWRACEPLKLPETPTAGFASISGGRVIFAALVHEKGGTGGLRCWLWGTPATVKEPGRPKWQAMSSPVSDDGKPLDVSPGAVVTTFGDHLAVARFMDAKAEVGLWSLSDGKPVKPLVEIPARQIDSNPRSSYRSLMDILILAVLMVVILLVFRRRHETLAARVVLPEQVVMANFPKRLGAALLDMLPAMILVSWLWYKPLMEFGDDVYAALASGGQWQDLPMPHTLLWADVAFRLFYTAYCLVFELLWSTTPGKRLMGCTVIGESLDRPTRLQIVGRNLTRPLEVEPAMLFFLAVVFFTPFRQRIGDLLARTVVIEGELPEEEEEEVKNAE